MSDKAESERRLYKRISRRNGIRIKEYAFPERGDYQSARFVDISGGGLLIETNHYIHPNTTLKIEMDLTGWQRYTSNFMKHFGSATNKPLVVLASVVRCKCVVAGAKYQIAVVFTGIDESHRQALIRFLSSEIIPNK